MNYRMFFLALFLAYFLTACKQPVSEKISMHLVLDNNPITTEKDNISVNNNKHSDYSLLPAHQEVSSENDPKEYWIYKQSSLDASDIDSVSLVIERENITPEQYKTFTDIDKITHPEQPVIPYAEYIKKPMIKLCLTSSGKKKLSELAKTNDKRMLAIVLDGLVISAPVINREIAYSSLDSILMGPYRPIQRAEKILSLLQKR